MEKLLGMDIASLGDREPGSVRITALVRIGDYVFRPTTVCRADEVEGIIPSLIESARMEADALQRASESSTTPSDFEVPF